MIESNVVQRPWFSAASVEACVLDYLERQEGCSILSSGHPSALGPGMEIVAACGQGEGRMQRLVSVIGWPETEAGAAENWHSVQDRPEITARTWLANALLELMLGRSDDTNVGLGLALPAIAGYIRYLQRLRWLLAAARIAVYLVPQDGPVTLTEPEATLANGEAAGGLARRKPGLPGASRLQLPLLHALIEAGGAANRGDVITTVARWFAQVPDPAPSEFGQRLSIAQSQLQTDGLTELQGRGVWAVTERGRLRHDAEWPAWATLQQVALRAPVQGGEQQEQ